MSSTSATVTGSVTSPGSDEVIAQITAANLPAGLYEVDVHLSYAGTITAATERNNMTLKAGSWSLVLAISGTNPNNPDAVYKIPKLRLRLDGATALAVHSVAAGTVGAVYTVTIVATPVMYGGA